MILAKLKNLYSNIQNSSLEFYFNFMYIAMHSAMS